MEGGLSIFNFDVFFVWLVAVGAEVFVFLQDAALFLNILSSQYEFIVLFLFVFEELFFREAGELFCGMGQG
jgi:hypothetical protein